MKDRILRILLKNYTKIGYKEGIAKVIFDDRFEDIAEEIVKNCSIQNVSSWLSFDTPPKAGQEILIVWETYPPEKRILTDEDLAKNWDGMRWLPIPAYR
ncbi:hypothetical protein [Roseivirga seohaensis]|uniref:hypothetical protein n=1 Tax=Roseivirga seohaensis TaxID=1914963 RepID=UPI003BAD733B